MKSITFLGASGTVTGSSYFLQNDMGKGVLVDYGMFQGVEEVIKHNHDDFPIDIENITAVLVTHAHLDHCGRLPLLSKYGYTGPVYMTKATLELCKIALYDAAKIAKYRDEEPLYTAKEVESLLHLVKTVEYKMKFTHGSYEVTYHDAGHILGSAFIEIVETKNASQKSLVFSGDIGNYPEPLLKSTEFIRSADCVVMESTYGDRFHSKQDASEIITSEINSVEDTKGTLLIPAFSIERTQELLHIIDHLKKKQKVKTQTKVFLDSPMAIKTTQTYKRFKQLYGTELREHSKLDDPFDFPGFSATETVSESKSIFKIKEPKVIIAGSGMMTGGRILHHAAHFLPDRNTRLLFVGYQGEETLGRKISEGKKTVRINDKVISIGATVSFLSSMSAHADQGQLINWLEKIENVQKVFLTHGEDKAREVLKHQISVRLHTQDIVLPHLYENHRITM